MSIILLIAGSRDTTIVTAHLEGLLNRWVTEHGRPTMVLHGGARGIDRMGGEWAKALGIPTMVYQPDWRGKGRGAGLARNTDMVEAATHVVAFHNGTSRGTADTMNKAKARGKPLKVYDC